jgi:hypothetical protein
VQCSNDMGKCLRAAERKKEEKIIKEGRNEN